MEKLPSEYKSIDEIEQSIDVLNSKFKRSVGMMWGSLPLITLFIATSIVGFATVFPWLAYGSLALTGVSIVSMVTNLVVSYKQSGKIEDLEREIHNRELKENVKKLAKPNQKTNETNVDVEKNITSQKQLNKTNNDENIFTY
ncbi:MAG: hypothetical protein J6Q13_02145 [Clostridia bacterium]|nr:hypothetical protein [Clostridia bacterium]